MRYFKRSITLITILCVAALLAGCFPADEDTAPEIFVVLGDSIAYGRVGTEDRETQSYAAIVADTNGYILFNDAVDGYESCDLLNQLQTNDEVRGHITDADIIVISIGGNDFLQNNPTALLFQAAGGDFSEINAILSAFEENLSNIKSAIFALNPTANVIIQTLYNPDYGQTRALSQPVIDMLNDIIIDTAGSEWRMLDVAAAFDGHAEYIYSDQIHPSIDGHAKIAELLLAMLDTERKDNKAA